jgi:hypothetical protein
MRNLALVFGALGFITFAGVARADQKSENTEKTDTSTTLTGKQKTTHVKRIERADGSAVETKTETTRPKNDVKRDEAKRDEAKRDEVRRDDNSATEVRHDDRADVNHDNGAEVKTTEHTTLTGKKQLKTTKKVDNADGSHTETTTTKTEPDRK